MKPPKPYTPYNHCDKCNLNYPHYNSTFTKCLRCEELKNELKDGRIEEHISKGLSGKYSKAPKSPTNGKIRSNYIGRNLRKLTCDRSESQKGMVTNGSEIDGQYLRERLGGKRQNKISQVSKKQSRINATLAKIKEQMVNDNDSQCFTCPKAGDVDLSHKIPRTKRKDLICDVSNLMLQCRTCHENWEHLNVFKIRKFRNLKLILDYIESVDQSRFIHIMTALDKQLIASR